MVERQREVREGPAHLPPGETVEVSGQRDRVLEKILAVARGEGAVARPYASLRHEEDAHIERVQQLHRLLAAGGRRHHEGNGRCLTRRQHRRRSDAEEEVAIVDRALRHEGITGVRESERDYSER